MTLPEAHPLRSRNGQLKLFVQLASCILLPGIVGQLTDFPILGLILGFALSHLLFRSLRNVDFWQPYLADLEPRNIWIARIGLIGVLALGVMANWSDKTLFPFLMGWAGFLSALLLESFVVRPALAKETNK